MRAANPYNYNLPVVPEMFFGRQEDVETLTHHLTAAPGDSFALIGGRRMGKTSLLEALLRALEPLVKDPARGLLPLPVFLDLSGEGMDSVNAFFHTVGERAQDALNELPALLPTDALAVGENQPPAPAFGRMLRSWGRTVMEQRGCRLRLILLLDECEQIVEQPWTPELYGALRSLLVGWTTRSLLKVVMTGSHRFLTQVRQRGSPLRNVLKYHRLCVLDGQATHDLVAQPTGGVLPKKVIQAIVGQSGGHPFLTQYLMHHLWERRLERPPPGTVQEVAAGFCHERNDFWDWTDGLGDSCLRIYGVLAQTGEALTEARVRAALHPCPQDLSQALDALCYHGLVVWEADGRDYRVTGQMFREWFAANVAERLEQPPTEQLSRTPQSPELGQEKSMNTLTWLHISDLHFRTSQSYDTNAVLRALLRDITKCINDDSLQPNFIILSGDIAFASRPEEYALAQQFLDDLLKTTSLPKDCLFLVPGNHDVDRNAISPLAAGATAILSNRDAVNRFLADDDDRARVFQRFHNYREFINGYLGKKHIPFDNARYFYVKHIEVAGRRVAILGLNSAWLAASDEDRNRLLLGERQVRTALDAAEDADLRLAVMHHPFDWLHDFDRDDAEPLLCSGCDFVLHGHMHQVGLLQARTPDAEAMIIAAGACYETRKYPNSYNFVQLDLSTGTGAVYLRMYSDKRGGFWTKDVVNYRNVSDGVYEFELPNHLRTKGHEVSTPSVKRPEPIKFTFTPPKPGDYQNWLSAFRRITEQHRAKGSWRDNNEAEHEINRLEDFMKPFCKGQMYDASFAIYSKDADGNFYEEVRVIVKVKPERELSFEVTDRTQVQKREELANTIQQEIGKLKGVQLISIETLVEASFAPAPELLSKAQEQEDWANKGKPSGQQRTTMTEQAEYKYDAFISYSHADRTWVWDELLPRLDGAGLRVCIDDRDFEIGVPSLVNMERAVDNSRHTLVVLTPAWIQSEWTEFESLLVGTADPAGRRRKLIPLMLKSCKLPPRIAMLTYADFTRPLEREAQMTRLVRSLGFAAETLSHPEPSEQRSQAVTAPNPFGDTGRITDPDRFFGREELLRQIFEELGKGVNLSLVGESQVGKSSLLSMVCALGPERMGLPPETSAYLSLEWVDNEDDFYEALCDALHIEPCRGFKLTRALRDKRYVLCLDEIEKMTWDGFTMRVRSQLRGLADGPAAPLKLVIASRSPLARLFPDSTELTSPLAGICRPLDVGPFPPDVAHTFLAHRLRNTGVTFSESEINVLLAETGGHPAKLQRAAADLYHRKCNLPESSELSGR